MSDSLQPFRWLPARLLCPWESSGKNTGVGCHALLQVIFVMSLKSPASAGRFFTTSATWESQVKNKFFQVLQPWSPDPHDSPGWVSRPRAPLREIMVTPVAGTSSPVLGRSEMALCLGANHQLYFSPPFLPAPPIFWLSHVACGILSSLTRGWIHTPRSRSKMF